MRTTLSPSWLNEPRPKMISGATNLLMFMVTPHGGAVSGTLPDRDAVSF
ncbi:MAG: hypothetical protein WC007_02995 [Pelobacteraceae bacterium]